MTTTTMAKDTIEHLMCPPPRRRLTWEMLNEVDQRLRELKHMARFAGISLEMSADGEDDTRFHIDREEGERLAFCVLNVESRIDDLLEFLKVVV